MPAARHPCQRVCASRRQRRRRQDPGGPHVLADRPHDRSDGSERAPARRLPRIPLLQRGHTLRLRWPSARRPAAFRVHERAGRRRCEPQSLREHRPGDGIHQSAGWGPEERFRRLVLDRAVVRRATGRGEQHAAGGFDLGDGRLRGAAEQGPQPLRGDHPVYRGLRRHAGGPYHAADVVRKIPAPQGGLRRRGRI